jgi:hypothetical protein
MNPIAIWCKFKGYSNWCYNYRIPDETEFVDGFEYEFLGFTITNYKLAPIEYIETPTWYKCKFGDGKGEYITKHNLKSYLEAGYIRVPKDDSLVYVKVDPKNEIFNSDLYYNGKKRYDTFIWKYTRYLFEINCIRSQKYQEQFLKPYIGSNDIIEYITVVNKYKMKEDLIKKLQKFINNPFSYSELLIFLDKQIDILLHNQEWENNKYIALWDTISDLERYFSYAQDSKYLIISNISIQQIVNYYYQKYMSKYESKTEKSKYKLDFNLIRPNLKMLSNLIKLSLSPIIPKRITFIDIINKYPNRWLGINKGYKPLHTIDEINHNLYNYQPEKSPNRLVYIATKDRQQYMRLPWKDANEKVITQLADEPQWEYISKKEGRHLLKPTPGQSFIPATEPWIEPETDEYIEECVGSYKNIYKERTKFPRPKSSTKRIDHSNHHKSKRSHPNRNNTLKEVLWNVTLTKHDFNSIGPVNECTFKIKATTKHGAIDKAWNEFVPLYDVKLNQIRPYYKAVVERSIENDTIDQVKGNNSTLGFLEAKKLILITKTKSGDKKLEEIVTYIRKYPELHPPWKTPKKWKCPMKSYSKKYLAKKLEKEREKLNEELKLKKQNKRITINKKQEKVLV